MLTGMGCDVLQGYYMSRPIPLEALQVMLMRTEGVFRHQQV